MHQRLRIAALTTAILALTSSTAFAQKKYDTGATDTEIKIGNIMPYSGPASAYGVIGKTETPTSRRSTPRAASTAARSTSSPRRRLHPAKAVEQARKLVERTRCSCSSIRSARRRTAIQKYLNAKKVPQLFVATGATKWGDPKDFPWTMGWQPSYQSEAQIYAKYDHGEAGRQDRDAVSERRFR